MYRGSIPSESICCFLLFGMHFIFLPSFSCFFVVVILFFFPFLSQWFLFSSVLHFPPNPFWLPDRFHSIYLPPNTLHSILTSYNNSSNNNNTKGNQPVFISKWETKNMHCNREMIHVLKPMSQIDWLFCFWIFCNYFVA